MHREMSVTEVAPVAGVDGDSVRAAGAGGAAVGAVATARVCSCSGCSGRDCAVGGSAQEHERLVGNAALELGERVAAYPGVRLGVRVNVAEIPVGA